MNNELKDITEMSFQEEIALTNDNKYKRKLSIQINSDYIHDWNMGSSMVY